MLFNNELEACLLNMSDKVKMTRGLLSLFWSTMSA